MTLLDIAPRARRSLAVCLCLSALLAGCADEEEAPGLRKFEPLPEREYVVTGLSEGQQAALIRRVEEKWRAMERWDFDAVYGYMTPNYRKIFS